jgi:RNA polymerase sigma-70 factor (ECF subfamily)
MTDLGVSTGLEPSQRAGDEARWADLMVRAQSGNSEAYGRLLGELGDVAESYLRRHFGESSLVEDCVQESLLSLHRARHTYDPRRPFRPWFFTIVKHRSLDMLRRRATRQRFEVAGEELEARANHTAAKKGEAAADTQRFLAELSTPHRQALILTKLEGHSISEAAKLAGISKTAMKSRVHRAIRLAQKLLERGAP